MQNLPVPDLFGYNMVGVAGGRLMEPRIQYAKTEDGVSIAFWAER
jgi:hypothetical protein